MVVEDGEGLSSPEPQLSPTGGDVGGSGYQRGAGERQKEAVAPMEPHLSESNRTSSGENENARHQVQESVKQHVNGSDSVLVDYHDTVQTTGNASIQANELKDKNHMVAELEFG